MKLLFSLFFVLFCLQNLLPSDFSFDTVNWTHNKKSSNMELYINRDDCINAYKVERTLSNQKADKVVQNILDFKNYPNIFPRTKNFQLIKKIDDNNYFIYALIDFFPMKNRDYYIILNYKKFEDDEKTTHIISWSPPSEEYKSYYENKTKENERVNFINGRWKIIEYNNGDLYISGEIYNNWNINVSKSVLESFEKQNAFDMISNILEYTFGIK
ncbi:MAG TPA: hypothetical protein PK771_11720 [Spirochaetota bacterium]|nr:hypothetical protein [Spirochaetota bacterium]